MRRRKTRLRSPRGVLACVHAWGVVFLLFAISVVLAMPALLDELGLDASLHRLLDLLRWPALLAVVALVLAIVYRFGPYHRKPTWRWITLGSGTASILWVAA